jgi:hypothetical protein
VLFNSLEFVVFAALVFPAYYAIHRWPARTTWLLLTSWLLYATWSFPFLALLIGTTWVDYAFAKSIHRARAAGTAVAERIARRRARTAGE